MMKITGRIIQILLLLFVTYDICVFLFLETPDKDKKLSVMDLYSLHKNQPIPDVIEMVPSVKYTSTETFQYKKRQYYEEFRKALKGKDVLRIRKRNGQYYWDSQGGIPLLVRTYTRGSEKYTVFVAYDASGVIVIHHDNSAPYFCHSYTGGNYKEYRLYKREWFLGGASFFPPKPEGWCGEVIKRKKLSLISKYLIK